MPIETTIASAPINRATAPELRKALMAANSMLQAGILFVPIPVLNQEDHAALGNEVQRRLAEMERVA